MNQKQLQHNCVGCGLCAGVYPDAVSMQYSQDGYIRPVFQKEFDQGKLEQLCPIYYKKQSIGELWGTNLGLYSAYANDSAIRTAGSSGGVITAMLLWLLQTKRVDAVVETGADRQAPLRNKTYVCTTAEEVLHCAGSRYAPAAPLENLAQILSDGKRIAFVGKPCDVRAIRNYMRVHPEAQSQILYVFSFFCAGTPSERASLKLADAVGADVNTIQKITYRGNGWPGYATVTDDSGAHTMDYRHSWGGILGRDKQQFCRICADGTGEEADIACGDCWHLTEEKKPSFEEAEGQNVVFLRTCKGQDLFFQAMQEGVLSAQPYDAELLPLIQPYQFERKATLVSQVLALKLFGKYVPQYRFSDLYHLSGYAPWRRKLRIFLGTVKRICRKAIR